MIKNVLAMYNCSNYIDVICKNLEMKLHDVLYILEKDVKDFHYTEATSFSQSHLKEILIDYVDRKLSSKVIAKKYGHCSKSILKILHANNITLRASGIQKIFEGDKLTIIKMYLDDIPTKTIASHFSVSTTAIIRLLHKKGIQIKEYKPTIESRQAHRKFFFNTNYFKTLNSPDKVYFLGLFAADGGFKKYHGTDNLSGITICLKESSYKILESFLRHIESNDKLRDGKHLHKYNGKTRFLHHKRVVVYSKVMAEDVRNQLELPDSFYKTFDIVYPKTIPLEFARHFCRGVLCGDGTIDPVRNKVVFYGTELLLEGIRKAICKNCPVSFIEIKPKVRKASKAKQLFVLAWSGKRQVLAILDWLYHDTNLYIEEKYDKYKSICRNKGIVNITDILSIEVIIKKRKDFGISQTEIARAISCSSSVISDLERNKRTYLTPILAKRLLDFFKIDYDSKYFFY